MANTIFGYIMTIKQILNEQNLNVKLKNGDCRDILNDMEKQKIDLCFTSPPYFDAINYDGHIQKTNGEKDWWNRKNKEYAKYLDLLEQSFEKVYEKTKKGGICVVNVSPVVSEGNRYPIMSDTLTIMERIGWDFYDDIIWNKEIARDRRSGVIMQHPYPGYYYTSFAKEYIYVFRKPGEKIYEERSEEEKKENNIKNSENLDISFESDKFQNELANGIWKIRPVPPNQSKHPAPFPIELANRVINLYSYKGDLILDPFMGSGTTGISAIKNDRNFIGIDKQKEFVNIAEERVNNIDN